jgi:hypothetical protein
MPSNQQSKTTTVKLPEVGDIVYWFGANGPNHALIMEKKKGCAENENEYYVLRLSGKPFEDTQWLLSHVNKPSWEIVG